jgi:plastocyanin
VKRAGLAILAAAALLVLAAVPAWSGEDGRAAPIASLSVSPQPVVAGAPAVLDASGSRDPDGTVVSYAWDLDGDGAFERQTGGEATIAHAFETAGERSVAVRALDESGESADATASVTVTEPQPEPAPAAPQDRQPQEEAAPVEEEQPAPVQEEKPRERVEREQPKRADRVQAAASASVSIRDFAFAPRSVTVSVGDSVTWRNTGDEPHTATARDGSFDTGNLASGQSGSATFNKAGTFSYFCKPHPFMTATVRVTGGGSGGGGSGSGGSGGSDSGGGDTQGVTGTGESGSSAGTADGGSLPSTGLALAPFLVIGLTMIGSGVALRRECATNRD